PAGEAFGCLQGIEGTVDLDTADRPRGIFQFPALQQALGVEIPPPGGIAPAGNTDMDTVHAVPVIQGFGDAIDGGSLAGKESSSASSSGPSVSSASGCRATLTQPQAPRSKALKAAMLSCMGSTWVRMRVGSTRPVSTSSIRTGM